ncbi:MAG TPA: GntR family transcriptional regulator [Planctomycetaceae bacterium]|nr:GntR family transcriptional regulator [Planctomycetaceae bacterium]
MTLFVSALPKHAVIFQSLHQAIKRGEFLDGARLPSETALARQFGASRPTVAQALRELQRLDLVERHRGAGTFVRSVPVAAGTLGLLADGLGATEIMEPISVEIARAARTVGWNILMGAAVADRSPDLIAREWEDRGASGVFFAPIEHHPIRTAVNRALVDCLHRRGVAVVLLDRDVGEFPERSAHDLVAIDDFFAGFELADHLIGRDSRRILFIARPQYPATTDLRVAGARAAVARAEKAELEFAVGAPEDKTWVGALLRRTRPDALIASNDATAARLLQTLQELGRNVPGDVKVCGFDDVRYASLLSPPLTTMRQPCAALGAAAIETMLGRLRQPHMPARRVLLRAELIVRRSTSAA